MGQNLKKAKKSNSIKSKSNGKSNGQAIKQSGRFSYSPLKELAVEERKL